MSLVVMKTKIKKVPTNWCNFNMQYDNSKYIYFKYNLSKLSWQVKIFSSVVKLELLKIIFVLWNTAEKNKKNFQLYSINENDFIWKLEMLPWKQPKV